MTFPTNAAEIAVSAVTNSAMLAKTISSGKSIFARFESEA